MTLVKLQAEYAMRDVAYSVAGLLQNIIDPAPDAVTIFADGAVWRVEAYFTETPDVAAVDAVIAEAIGASTAGLALEAVPDVNWVAISQAALPPVEAGRFTVHGTHDRSRVARGPWSILIDAGEAFGTAHHATTLGCLIAIDRLARRGPIANVLDLGTGSGVLAIAVARLAPRARVLATDLDVRSVEVARENFAVNGVARRVRGLAADGLDHPAIRKAGPFDLIIANILAAPLIRLAPDIARRCRPGAPVILSGLLIDQAAEVSAAYRASGFNLVRHDRIAGWATLTLRKR